MADENGPSGGRRGAAPAAEDDPPAEAPMAAGAPDAEPVSQADGRADEGADNGADEGADDGADNGGASAGPSPAPPRSGDDFDREAESRVARDAATERGDFLRVMGHFYRGEMARTTLWRDRLDKTGNWSVILVATLLTWAFTSSENPHSVILLGIVMVSLFLLIEARRYRFYDVCRSRVRMLEENLFAEALDPRGTEHDAWRTLLSEDLRRPTVKVPLREAVARRLRRVYLPLFTVLVLAWFARISTYVPDLRQALGVAGVWRLPGVYVVAAVVGFYVLLVLTAAWPMPRRAKGELRHDGANDESWKNGR